MVSYRLRSWARGRWRGSILLALVVAMGGALALSLVAGTLRTATAPDRYVDAWGADHDVTVEQAAGRPRIDELGRLDSVHRIDMATFVFGGLVSGDGDSIDTLTFAGSQSAIGTRTVEGRDPDPDRPGEFVATRDVVQAAGLELGDELQLITITQATSDSVGFDAPEPDGPTIPATLVGIIAGPGQVAGDGYPVAVFPPALLDQGDIGVSASEGAVELAPGASIDDLRAEIDRLPDPEQFGLDLAEVVPRDVRAAVTTQARGLGLLSLIVGVTVLSVIGQLLSRQFRLDSHERQVLRSLGYSRPQLAVEQAVRTVATAGSGTACAVGLAWIASSAFPTGLSRDLEPDPGRRLDLLAHGAGALAFVGALALWVGLAQALDHRVRSARDAPGLVDRLVPSLPSASATTGLRFAFPHSGAGVHGAVRRGDLRNQPESARG